MEYLVKDLAIVLITIVLFLNSAPAGPAEVGDLINSFQSRGGNGLAWREDCLWEIGENCTPRRCIPVIVPYTEITNCSIRCGGDLTWDTKRGTWWLTNPFAGRIEQIGPTGGPSIGRFVCTLWIAGLFYHEDTDRFWIGSKFNGGFGEYQADGSRERVVNLDYSIGGIARVGDYLWVGGPLNAITRLNLDGSPTGVSFNLPTGLTGGSLTFDGQYLWVLCHPWIYQCNIGVETPPPPTPTPTPTPTT